MSQPRVQSHVSGLLSAGVAFKEYTPFLENSRHENPLPIPQTLLGKDTLTFRTMLLNPTALRSIQENKEEVLRLAIPDPTGEVIHLLLYAKTPLSAPFAASYIHHHASRFFRGTVEGKPESLVAVSMLEDELRALIIIDGNTWVLGKVMNTSKGLHVLYKVDEFLSPGIFGCDVLQHPDTADNLNKPAQYFGAEKSEKCVRVRMEVDAGLVIQLGGIVASEQYVMGLFNEISTLFDNDGISIALSEIHCWTDDSPYTAPISNMLVQMDNDSPNAELSALLTNVGGGGIAYLGSVCSANFGVSVSNVFGWFNELPVYSWDVNVCAHEIGHNLNSPHTHACAWNGNNTPLDGCGIQAGFPEGNCGSAPIPEQGGTIMSYCHIFGVGVNFSNGFGSQPSSRMLNYINSRACLGNACFSITQPQPVPCEMPYPQVEGLSVSVLPTGALLEWEPILGSKGCQIRGGLVGAAGLQVMEQIGDDLDTWLIPASAFPVNGEYRIQVRCGCSKNPNIGGTWSPFVNFAWAGAAGLFSEMKPYFTSNHDGLTVYPNPTHARLNVKWQAEVEGIAEVQILDAMGRRLFAERRNTLKGAQQWNLDLPALAKGYYILLLMDPDGAVMTTQIAID